MVGLIKMEQKKTIKCACGWELSSPMGETDLLKHGKIHADDTHPEMKLSRDDLKKYIQ